ncbi:MAG TPA: hypothetical protein VG073_08220 [Gaiellaceae bacterium]|nr:hypothetical protein [Gaiellaceae bacterium]
MIFVNSVRMARRRGPRSLSAPLRISSAAAATAALAIAAVLLLAGGRDDADSAPHSLAAIPVTVGLDARRPGRPVQRRFLGLSFELAALPRISAYADSGNLVGLLRSLGPGVLRFGGVSADTQVAWVDRRTPAPPWATATVTPSDLRRLGRLAARSGWRVLLTIGVLHYEPIAAAREAAAAKAALGPRLAAIEIGNEPDAYASHHFRSLPWTYAQYDAEVTGYRRAIAIAAHGIRLAGPGVSGSQIFQTWGPGEAAAQRPWLLTGHHYPLGCHQVPPPSIQRLLSPEIRMLEAQSLRRFMTVSRSSSIPFRLDEVNSVSCGGTAGISNTFAAALWATGYIAQAMAAGVAGINFQGNPANCRGYSPLCAPTPARLARGVLGVQPEWYALLLARHLLGSRPVHAYVVSSGAPNLVVRAFEAGDGTLRVVIVDEDPLTAAPAAVKLHTGRRYRSMTVLALSAPSTTAGTGVRLGGRSVARDGSWSEPSAAAKRASRPGSISVTVAPSTAVLLTLPSSG